MVSAQRNRGDLHNSSVAAAGQIFDKYLEIFQDKYLEIFEREVTSGIVATFTRAVWQQQQQDKPFQRSPDTNWFQQRRSITFKYKL